MASFLLQKIRKKFEQGPKLRVNIDCKNMFYFQFIMSQKWFTEKEEKKLILYIKPYRNIMMGPYTYNLGACMYFFSNFQRNYFLDGFASNVKPEFNEQHF